MTTVPPSRGRSVRRLATAGLLSWGAWVVAVLLLLPLLPLLAVLGLGARGRAWRVGFARGFLRFFFSRLMPACGLYRITGAPDPATVAALAPCVFVANHRSWLDGLLALAFFPKARLAVRGTYLRVPLLGLAIGWAGGVPFDRHDLASIARGLARCRQALDAGESLFLFPEAVRAPFGELRPFHDFPFHLAREAGVPIVPVVLHCSEPYLGVEGRLLTTSPALWTIQVLESEEPRPTDRPAELKRVVRKRLAAGLAPLDRIARPGAQEEP